ncbi:hypothetical protein CAPTEDRAFT_184272 [Capitella teleta]|uniref:Peptidyl-prolyl cis-trans isomerase n=1 Tax=Capitella teleta TaxID=283909 RepID=X1ZGX6_CAPTE|nr:hypothetical protein CAPTEDRAFT_184272 [Capitella teleta]|eukprot:ELU00334.1 hypothetical protein CAPTEDRAFT_184272 [Capitella teleta]
MANEEKLQISVIGLLSDITFHVSKLCAEDLATQNPDDFIVPLTEGLLEFEWDIYIEEKCKDLGSEMWVFKDKSVIFVNNRLIGGPEDLLLWAEEKFNYKNFRPLPLYEALAESSYKKHLNATHHDFVFMDISIGDSPVGRLVFELFTELVPKTCENFRALCTGEKGKSEQNEYALHFLNSIFHRIVPRGWVQGGDIWLKKGDGGESIYGECFPDENFAVRHNKRGILGMANHGPHSNGSQFYITLEPAAWMDTKYVAFGQVIEGTETLRAIESQSTNNQRPLKEIKVTDCGVCTYEF